MANTSVLGYSGLDMLPPMPQAGANQQETIDNLLDFCQKMLLANSDLLARLHTQANIGFLSYTDGTNTEYSKDDSALDLSSLAATIDFDLPLTEGITWSVDNGVPKWTSGTVSYGGTNYTITAWQSGNTTNSTRGIYWDLSSPTVLSGSDLPTSASNRWYLAFFDGTEIYSAMQSTIIHGGLIQGSTITANKIILSEINTSDITNDSNWDDTNTVLNNTTITGGKIDIDTLYQNTSTGTYNLVKRASLTSTGLVVWSQIDDDDLKKPDDNADVTGDNVAASIVGQQALATATHAAWATQLSGIPSYLGTAAGGIPAGHSGVIITAAALGYYDTGVLKSYIDNTGVCYFGDGTDPATDSGNYLYFNPSTNKIKIRAEYGYLGSADTYLNIDSGKLVLKGSSWKLTGDDDLGIRIDPYNAINAITVIDAAGIDCYVKSVNTYNGIYIRATSDIYAQLTATYYGAGAPAINPQFMVRDRNSYGSSTKYIQYETSGTSTTFNIKGPSVSYADLSSSTIAKTCTATSSFTTIASGGSVYGSNIVETYGASSEYSYMMLRKSKSNTDGTVAATSSGDNLGSVRIHGANSAGTPAFAYGGYIRVMQEGAATTTYCPSRMEFTVADAAGTGLETMTFDSNGDLDVPGDIVVDGDTSDLIKNAWFKGNTYTGDGNATQSITHGLGRTPKFVIVGSHVHISRNTQTWSIGGGSSKITSVGGTTFTVNDSAANYHALNTNTVGYYWVCF